jgi:DNA gyrase subunit A
MQLIRDEIEDIKKRYGDGRKTEMINSKMTKNFNFREFVENKTEVVLLTENGYVKRMPLSEYRTQNRAGHGIKAINLDEDKIKEFEIANTHDILYLYTSKGRLFTIDAYDVPEASRGAKGRYLANFLN